jgi:hypothetical protein
MFFEPNPFLAGLPITKSPREMLARRSVVDPTRI